MVIEAPSLRFTTEFDAADTCPKLPINVVTGQHAAVRVADNVQRRPERLGRCEGSPALVGLKLTPDVNPLRVTVTLRADRTTAGTWDRSGPSDHRGDHFGPRLLLVRSQGATRAAVMIARGANQFEFDARPIITYDLPPNAVDADGLLIVELAEAPLPAWASDRLTAMPAVGVGIDKIAVRPIDGDEASDGVAMLATAPVLGDVEAPAGDAAALGGGFIPVGPGTLAGDHTSWLLRAGVLRAVNPDPPPLDRTGPFPVRIPGAPDLTNRDKMRQLINRKLEDVQRMVTLAVRHIAVRAGRVLAYPFAALVIGFVVSRESHSGRLSASLLPLGTDSVPGVTVARHGWRTVRVSVPYQLNAPALLSLRTGNQKAGWLAWRLVRARHDPAGHHR